MIELLLMTKSYSKSAGITAVDWDAGAVSSTTQDVAYPVTALRLVQIGAGTAKMSVRAQ